MQACGRPQFAPQCPDAVKRLGAAAKWLNLNDTPSSTPPTFPAVGEQTQHFDAKRQTRARRLAMGRGVDPAAMTRNLLK
jgi:hypothetical protein